MKVALVTGASRGLGAEIARALGADGWSVAVNYFRNGTAAKAVVTAIEARGGRAIASGFDVTDEDAVTAGLDEIERALGPIDLVVNNATGEQPNKAILDQSWDDHLAQLVFFVKAPTLILQHLLPDWRQRKTGRVINIGSEVVDLGNPELTPYVAAKAAMLGLTRSWARELGPDNITVNLVAPGWIPTDRHATSSAESKNDYARLVPLGRQGDPSDLSGMIVFLASDGASFITGQTFAVNGGRTLA